MKFRQSSFNCWQGRRYPRREDGAVQQLVEQRRHCLFCAFRLPGFRNLAVEIKNLPPIQLARMPMILVTHKRLIIYSEFSREGESRSRGI